MNRFAGSTPYRFSSVALTPAGKLKLEVQREKFAARQAAGAAEASPRDAVRPADAALDGDEGRAARAELFDARRHHAAIVASARGLFVGGHLQNAVLDACKKVSERVQARSGVRKDGDALMAESFKQDGGLLRFNSLETSDDRNEQRGMMLLFQGMWAAIRNPNAHRFLQVDQVSALEHLAFLSMLLRYLDSARRAGE
ncbi:MAG TPA: TIGR02391 family protein [Archangium sp.]